jgi:hypothetical protein
MTQLCADCEHLNDCFTAATPDRAVWNASVNCTRWRRVVRAEAKKQGVSIPALLEKILEGR